MRFEIGKSKMNAKEIDKQVLGRRTETIKTVYIFNLVVGFLLAFFVIVMLSLLAFFPQTESWGVFVVIAVSIGFGVYSVIEFVNAFKNKKILNLMYSANSDESEEKELFCYKFDYLSALCGGPTPHSGRRYAYSVRVNTVHGKFYYVLQKEIDRDILSAHCRDLYSGEHTFEVYKGTNIIKKLPALEKMIRSIPRDLLDY